MPTPRSAVLVLAACAACSSGQSGLGGDDQDGVVGGDVTFEVVVNDAEYSPTAIWKTQNLANVTLTLRNDGTRPHGYRVHCATGGCFPPESTIPPLGPGESATAKWQVPYPEGIHDVDDATGDPGSPTGQFIVQ